MAVIINKLQDLKQQLQKIQVGGGSNLVNIGKSLLTMGAGKLFDLPTGLATVAKKVAGPIQRALTPKATKDIADARLSGSFTTSYNYQPKTYLHPVYQIVIFKVVVQTDQVHLARHLQHKLKILYQHLIHSYLVLKPMMMAVKL
jgi:hypothetical protein